MLWVSLVTGWKEEREGGRDIGVGKGISGIGKGSAFSGVGCDGDSSGDGNGVGMMLVTLCL